MSYEIRKSEEIPGIDISGQPFVMPIELPMYKGSTADLGSQALHDLGSFLRHQASCETLEDYFDMQDPAVAELWNSEHGMMTAKFVAVLIAMAGIADNLGIDIMEEIWEMPWEV